MKNHRIIKIGLIIPDISQIKDYQISLINSLKKNKEYEIKLIKTNSNLKKKENRLLFFFEKKFQKRKKSLSLNNINFIKKAIFIPINKIIDYKKKDIDIFINILGSKFPSSFKNNTKPFWDINYGYSDDSSYPICFDDLIFQRPYSSVKITETFRGKYKEVIKGKFNIRSYALLHEEFVLEKTIVLVIKALNLFTKQQLNYKKILQRKNKNLNINIFHIFNYYKKRYFEKISSTYKSWKIFYLKNKKDINLTGNKFIKYKTNEYFADPFIYKFKSKIFIFFENFNKDQGKGNISFVDLSNNQKKGQILSKNYHLSYPFIFNFKKKIYLSPETAKAKELQIWKCTSFPTQWKLYKKAFKNQSMADPTFFYDKKKRLWLFINKSIDKYNDHNSELYIYEVKNNFRDFIPHKLNPVIIDCTIARNAGNLFYYKSKLIKPCQININGEYGYGLQLIEIKKLSLDEFIYIKIKSYRKIHHLSHSNNYIAWDKAI